MGDIHPLISSQHLVLPFHIARIRLYSSLYTRRENYQGKTVKGGDINHLISSQHHVLPFHISTINQISSSLIYMKSGAKKNL